MKAKLGRPPYAPSKAVRKDVEVLLAAGCTERQIAAKLGISQPTFRKTFAFEVQDGHARGRVQIVGMLVKSARDGNVSAQKKLEELSRLADADRTARALEQVQPAAARGKKEQAKIDAQDAAKADDWGDDLNPNSNSLN